MNRLSTAVFCAVAASLVATPVPAAVINVPGDAPTIHIAINKTVPLRDPVISSV